MGALGLFVLRLRLGGVGREGRVLSEIKRRNAVSVAAAVVAFLLW